jgi:hypothetical protein
MGIHGIYVLLDHGDEETFTETGHDVGCKTTVADYGSTDDPPSCVDCSPLVGITPIDWNSADNASGVLARARHTWKNLSIPQI